MKYNLHVCIPTRDRSILTFKSIQSIRENLTKFQSINIYVFDNLSSPEPKRFKTFVNLLNSGEIQYYSYDSLESTNRCFPKAVIFRRFIDMMKEKRFIKKRRGVDMGIKDMYILSDNDMIYGPRFDDHFISALDFVNSRYPSVHFLVKFPGGIPSRSRQQALSLDIDNIFDPKSKVKLHLASGGGGSGCWVMSDRMLDSVRWADDDILKVYGKYKQHDTITWALIRKKQNNAPYVCGVQFENEEKNPPLLHIGGKLGSICNSLTNNSYKNQKQQFEIKESELANMTISEILKRYRGLTKW